MTDILREYTPITLEEMKSVRLMNRIDTKYLTTRTVLSHFLEQALAEYRLQEIDGEYLMPYHTLYFDTKQCSMYMDHLHGHKTRQKIRIRTYETSDVSFLEIKNKNNKGRTKKKRIQCNRFEDSDCTEFIGKYARYTYSDLLKQIENRFTRITLVNRKMTERLTIDTGLKFHNCQTEINCKLENLVIIELKRDGHTVSESSAMLRNLRIQPAKFSKYCMGMALTDSGLKHNRFKPRLRTIDKLCNINKDIQF